MRTRRRQRFFRIGLELNPAVFQLNEEGMHMPAFSFEKISPPVRRAAGAPVAATSVVPRRRGLIVQIIDRFVEVRVKRTVQDKGARHEPKS
jgi:hypothetical protein